MRDPSIPDMVHPVPGALVVDASLTRDVQLVAQMLRNAHSEVLNMVVAGIIALDIMQPAGWQAKFLEFFIKWGAKRKGVEPFTAWTKVFEQQEVLRDSIRDGTVDWMINGRALDDPRAVGGFSTRELQTIVNLLVLTQDKLMERNRRNHGVVLPAPHSKLDQIPKR